jgi:hypothetical protein
MGRVQSKINVQIKLAELSTYLLFRFELFTAEKIHRVVHKLSGKIKGA